MSSNILKRRQTSLQLCLHNGATPIKDVDGLIALQAIVKICIFDFGVTCFQLIQISYLTIMHCMIYQSLDIS